MTRRFTIAMLAMLGSGLAMAVHADEAMVDGEVTRIDEAAGKLTIRHGPIKKLGMNEGMMMVFRVNDPAMLKQVKVGDKIRFEADRVKGQFTVMKLEKAH